MKQSIVIDIRGQPKERPRFSPNGHAYTSTKTREYEDMIRRLWLLKRHKPHTGPVMVRICFLFRVPKSWSKKEQQAALDGRMETPYLHDMRIDGVDDRIFGRPYDKRPDIDNLTKAILDSLNNGVGFYDDAQVCAVLAIKQYGDRDSIIIQTEDM